MVIQRRMLKGIQTSLVETKHIKIIFLLRGMHGISKQIDSVDEELPDMRDGNR